MATRHYRLGQRRARQAYDPGRYHVVHTVYRQPPAVDRLGREGDEARTAHYRRPAPVPTAAEAAAKAAADERSRLYNRPLPAELRNGG